MRLMISLCLLLNSCGPSDSNNSPDSHSADSVPPSDPNAADGVSHQPPTEGSRDDVSHQPDRHTEVESTRYLSGTYKHVNYFSVDGTEQSYAEVQLGDKTLSVTLTDQELISVSGQDNDYSAEEVELLDELSEYVKKKLAEDNSHGKTSNFLLNSIVLMRSVASHPQLAQNTYNLDDIECLDKGVRYQGFFDDKYNNEIHGQYWVIGQNGNERGGCGDDFWVTAYTQDCLNHDLCQKYMQDNQITELRGGLGPNCLDEFIEAIDDFFLGAFKGCRL